MIDLMKVELFPEADCPRCGRKLDVVVGEKARPDDRLFCVIHGRVGLRAEMDDPVQAKLSRFQASDRSGQEK